MQDVHSWEGAIRSPVLKPVNGDAILRVETRSWL